MVRSARRGPADEAGVATLAAVAVLPAVILLVSAVAQFVVYYHAANLATAAAADALRAAQLADGSEEEARDRGQALLADAAPGLVLDPVVTVRRDAAAGRATAEVHGRAPRLVPVVPLGLEAVATGPVEAFEGGG